MNTAKDNILNTALALATTTGWDSVSLHAIAEEADTPLSEVHAYFEDRFDLLCYLGRTIDKKVLENLPEYGKFDSEKDRLFDVLMTRFDVLNEQRESITAILSSFRHDPKQAVISLPYLGRSMTWMLEAAHIDTTGIKGALRVAGITGIYLKTLRVWKDDDSADMAKTMAALDKNLSHGARVARLFKLDKDLRTAGSPPSLHAE